MFWWSGEVIGRRWNTSNGNASLFYWLKSGHAVSTQYLKSIRKRTDVKCLWCGHEDHTRDHQFRWCKRCILEQKQHWVDGQEGEEGDEGIEEVWKSWRLVCQCLLFLQRKNVPGHCWISFLIQMLRELAEKWRRQRIQIMRSQVIGVCTCRCCFLAVLGLSFGRWRFEPLLLRIDDTAGTGMKCVRDMPWSLGGECNMIIIKQSNLRILQRGMKRWRWGIHAFASDYPIQKSSDSGIITPASPKTFQLQETEQ